MKIGIVSDTHGKARRLAAALEAFAQRDVEAVVHCGDVGSVECVEMLGACGRPAYLVAGNMDRHAEQLRVTAERCGVNFSWEVVQVPIKDGELLVATHSHDEGLLGALIVGQQFAFICHGHTHRFRDEHIGRARLINPGALYHPRDHIRSVAVLDTQSGQLERIEIR